MSLNTDVDVCSRYCSPSAVAAAGERFDVNKLNGVLSVQKLCYAIRKCCCSPKCHFPDQTNLEKKVLFFIKHIEAIMMVLIVNWALIFHWHYLICSFSILCHWHVSTNTGNSNSIHCGLNITVGWLMTKA